MKNNIYRVEIQYTDPGYDKNRLSIMFFRTTSAEIAAAGAKKQMDQALIEGGFQGAKYDITVYASTEEEATEYKKQMGYRSN